MFDSSFHIFYNLTLILYLFKSVCEEEIHDGWEVSLEEYWS